MLQHNPVAWKEIVEEAIKSLLTDASSSQDVAQYMKF